MPGKDGQERGNPFHGYLDALKRWAGKRKTYDRF